MKILLATPIYPPEIGGPAIYVQKLKEGLEKREIKTKVLSYQNFKKYPQPLRIFLYFLKLLRKAGDSDIVYAFNLLSCGLPTYLVSKILKKRFIIRIGGDFLWERAIEQGRTEKSLREYYSQPKTLKEKILIKIIKKILNRADKIILTGNFLKDVYIKYLNFSENKIAIIPNPFPEIGPTNYELKTINYQLLYAGRLLRVKNLDTLIKVFKKISEKTNQKLALKIIGEGPELNNLKLQIANLKLENRVIIENPIPHQDLLKEIQKSYLCVLPSLTEVSPNFALECIKLQKPILLTKETEYYEVFKNLLIFINPKDEIDIEEKIIYLLDEKNYQNYIEKTKSIPTFYSWEDVIEKHVALFKELI